MKKDPPKQDNPFREKAEEKLRYTPSVSILDTTHPGKLTESNLLKLIHELEVHQIELEMMNEELSNAIEKKNELEEKYSELFDFAPVGYFLLSREGTIIELNLNGAKLLNKERSYLIKKQLVIYVTADTKQIFSQFLDSLFSSVEQSTCDIALQGDSDSSIFVHLSGIAQNQKDQCLVTAVDITKRKKAEEELKSSEHELRMLSESMPQIVWITRADGYNIYFNQHWVEYTGLSLEESYGPGWNKPFHPDDQVIAWNAWQNAVSYRTTYSLECRLRRHDGIYKWWLIRGVPLLDAKGTVLKWFGTCTEIDELKCKEAELVVAKDHALQSDRLKSAFLANMSHEIRTPMNGILGFSGLLKEPSLSGAQQQEYIRIIEKSGNRMLNIINNIVDISKIESGLMEVNLCETNVNDKVEFVCKFFKPEIEGKGITISFRNGLPATEAIVLSDSEKIYAILTNLVKNALKYTDAGTIEIGYDVIESHDRASLLQFFVKDSGIGIPKERQEAIFERFIQADIADKHAYQGAGLGLSISKAYVEMLGGKIWVESDPEGENETKGSTFYFTLPYNGPSKNRENDTAIDSREDVETLQATSPNATSLQTSPMLKILIVEDDDMSELFLRSVLQKFSREILVATSGFAAIEKCRCNPDIDLIMMDIKMPLTNGYEATRLIRQFNKNVIIIAQTAFGLAGDREKALEAGCDDYLSKPIYKDQLIHLIQKYFN